MKPEVAKIFDDLDAYRDFCRFEGHVFNEAHLYKENTPWGEFQRSKNNARKPRDNRNFNNRNNNNNNNKHRGPRTQRPHRAA